MVREYYNTHLKKLNTLDHLKKLDKNTRKRLRKKFPEYIANTIFYWIFMRNSADKRKESKGKPPIYAEIEELIIKKI